MDTQDFNIDLVARMLRFANMPESEIVSAKRVEAIFDDHPHARASLFKHKKVDTDVQDFIQLRRDLRDWLRVIAAEQFSDAVNVRDEMVKRYQEKATLTATIKVVTVDGKKHDLQVELWGLPHLGFERGQLAVNVQPFLTGVESAVYFAVICLFATGKKISICQAPLPNQKRVVEKERCGKFFLKTDEHRATCSGECSELRRREQVSQSVIRLNLAEREKAKQKRAKTKRRAK